MQGLQASVTTVDLMWCWAWNPGSGQVYQLSQTLRLYLIHMCYSDVCVHMYGDPRSGVLFFFFFFFVVGSLFFYFNGFVVLATDYMKDKDGI